MKLSSCFGFFALVFCFDLVSGSATAVASGSSLGGWLQRIGSWIASTDDCAAVQGSWTTSPTTGLAYSASSCSTGSGAFSVVDISKISSDVGADALRNGSVGLFSDIQILPIFDGIASMDRRTSIEPRAGRTHRFFNTQTATPLRARCLLSQIAGSPGETAGDIRKTCRL